ncbi:polyhydroxyalkanoate synthesis repressor PhaR [Sandaracinobacter neustonicus]|uniref:Polyhydroxyalkanoate synthesis repressor PhaR n=1 Tax=Sandaracinobacter neustonicus TaxID=1715348 RepID=A0A501XUH9_9SPHN|nr:polyhydroxyalkanoate synthesis repressor PhaR [Sandaracinobacter neustonicus]TPE63747.1 polyhydroxyalkanoate synthesis repressor PhaR [Sandaracinobacter neustonicus]
MAQSPEGDTAPVIIKKYANRRLYDTESSSYITLEHLSAMTRQGREFKVVDAKSGDDITHSVLTQIIVEEENRGTTLLPVSFLRQLIAMYGDQMQSMVPHYLEASMEAFRRNQEQVRSTMMGMMAGGSNPFEALARQNMAMMKAATDIWGAAGVPGVPGAPKAETPEAEPAESEADVKALKAELKALQAKIEKLVKD